MIKIETHSSLIARYDNVMQEDHCDFIIEHIKSVVPIDRVITDGMPWHNNDNIPFVEINNKPVQDILDAYRFLLCQLVFDHYKDFVFPNFCDLVVWRPGMSMPYHKDDGYEDTPDLWTRKYSSVLYLNDDYIGGQTLIKKKNAADFVSYPKKGSVVIFKSNEECLHGVSEIVQGTRYTFATWFTNNINDCELK